MGKGPSIHMATEVSPLNEPGDHQGGVVDLVGGEGAVVPDNLIEMLTSDI